MIPPGSQIFHGVDVLWIGCIPSTRNAHPHFCLDDFTQRYLSTFHNIPSIGFQFPCLRGSRSVLIRLFGWRKGVVRRYAQQELVCDSLISCTNNYQLHSQYNEQVLTLCPLVSAEVRHTLPHVYHTPVPFRASQSTSPAHQSTSQGHHHLFLTKPSCPRVQSLQF